MSPSSHLLGSLGNSLFVPRPNLDLLPPLFFSATTALQISILAFMASISAWVAATLASSSEFLGSALSLAAEELSCEETLERC